MANPKVRVDRRVLELGLAETPEQAHRLILAGVVRHGDRVYDKPGHLLPADTPLSIKDSRCNWVSRGGDKLEQALVAFAFDPTGLKCLDIGASTGGFTHVLLKHGAREITALDVGYGILDWTLRQDPRVVVIERTNFRSLPPAFFPEPFDLIVIDVSFISLHLILPKAIPCLKPDGTILALIKPQFEAERGEVAPGGKVLDSGVRERIVCSLRDTLSGQGLHLHRIIGLQKSEPGKNLELFSSWKQQSAQHSPETLTAAIKTAAQEP